MCTIDNFVKYNDIIEYSFLGLIFEWYTNN